VHATSRLATTMLICVGCFLWHTGVGAASLLVNGDFGLGNTGFTGNYVFTSDTTPNGTFCADTDPITPIQAQQAIMIIPPARG
jgi:hypothetical protein